VLASLLALRKQGQPDEVILVDNASDEDIQAVARIAQLPLRVLHLPQHQSLGAAFNAGIDTAAHDTILLLHSDALIESNPGVAVRWLQRHKKVGIIGARLFPEGDEPRTLLQLGYKTDRGRMNPHPVAEKKWDTWRKPVGMEAVGTACMLIRRTDLRFDERYWFRLEDVDFCHQYAQHSLGIVTIPDLRATHLLDGGLKQRQMVPEWAARQIASQLLYHERWCSDAPLAKHPRQPGVRGDIARNYYQQAAPRLTGTPATA
jgi:GT2 family glycosyltransferase